LIEVSIIAWEAADSLLSSRGAPRRERQKDFEKFCNARIVVLVQGREATATPRQIGKIHQK
jgi:hypothetical protein